jgi:hypothetical protein
MEPVERQMVEGSHISQAFLEGLDGKVGFTKNGLRFWWPKFLMAGVNPRTILTKKDLQYAVRRVAARAFQETADEAKSELANRRFMSPVERAELQQLAASPEDQETATKNLFDVLENAKN